MANFAVIKDGIVTNTIVADSKAIAEEVTGLEVLEATGSEPWIGWNRSNGTWIAPVVVEDAPTE